MKFININELGINQLDFGHNAAVLYDEGILWATAQYYGRESMSGLTVTGPIFVEEGSSPLLRADQVWNWYVRMKEAGKSFPEGIAIVPLWIGGQKAHLAAKNEEMVGMVFDHAERFSMSTIHAAFKKWEYLAGNGEFPEGAEKCPMLDKYISRSMLLRFLNGPERVYEGYTFLSPGQKRWLVSQLSEFEVVKEDVQLNWNGKLFVLDYNKLTYLGADEVSSSEEVVDIDAD